MANFIIKKEKEPKQKLPNAIVFDIVPTVYDGNIAVRNVYTDLINPMYNNGATLVNTDADIVAIGNTLPYVFENRVLYFLQIIDTNTAVKIANEYGIEAQRVFNEINKTEDIGKLRDVIIKMSNYISFDNSKESFINPSTIAHIVASMSTDVYNVAHGYMMGIIYDSCDAKSYDVINRITKEYSEELNNMFNVLFDEIFHVYGPQLLRCLFASNASEKTAEEVMDNLLALDGPIDILVEKVKEYNKSHPDHSIEVGRF